MKEIRIHGRGGQGTVKASEIMVYAAVKAGQHAQSVPYFGFERSGAPVSAFVRLSPHPIWPKTQIYRPDCLMIMDSTLREAVPIFAGVKEGATVVLNGSASQLAQWDFPPAVTCVGWVDANAIALEILGRALPNTVMLGAFARTTGWLDEQVLAEKAGAVFGEKNYAAVKEGFARTQVYPLPEGGQ